MEQYGAFSALYDVLMADVDYDRWANLIATLIKENYSSGHDLRVLDCASGTGAIAVRLAKMGYSVTGADISDDMLRYAIEKSRRMGLRVPFVRMDMRKIALHKKQHVITCCCDGVNYLTSVKDVGAFFASAREYLLDNGLLLFDVSTRYKLSEVIGCRQMGEDREECTYLWENMYDPKSHLIEMDLHFFVPSEVSGMWKRFDEKHIQRAHTVAELEKCAGECGFSVLKVIDFDTGTEPGETTERVQFVLRRCN